MTAADDINRALREHKRFTGDGLPNEPAGAPLPVGDPSSGPHNPVLSELRAPFTAALTEIQVAQAAAVSAAANATSIAGRGIFASLAALEADNNTLISYAGDGGELVVSAGSVVEAGGMRYAVAASGASDHDVITTGGVKLYFLPPDSHDSFAEYRAAIAAQQQNAALQAIADGDSFSLGNVVRFTSGTGETYNRPAGVRALEVKLIGGGAGGGGVQGSGAGTSGVAASGAGGATVEKFILNPALTYIYTVGPGGVGGSAGANNGSPGGASTFTDGASLTLTANGGNGGSGDTGSSGDTGGSNGAFGGTGTGGDLNIPGSGSGLSRTVGGVISAASLPGASSLGGGLPATIAATANGASAVSPGCGGQGASVVDSSVARAGGDGLHGLLEIKEWY